MRTWFGAKRLRTHGQRSQGTDRLLSAATPASDPMNQATDTLAFRLSTALLGCAADTPTTIPKLRRVGHTYVNGNCALDADQKLTGLCVGGDRSGTKCTAHQPGPDSKPCSAGVAAAETRGAACASGSPAELVSRQDECSFVEEP
jgi:hypothetical protein